MNPNEQKDSSDPTQQPTEELESAPNVPEQVVPSSDVLGVNEPVIEAPGATESVVPTEQATEPTEPQIEGAQPEALAEEAPAVAQSTPTEEVSVAVDSSENPDVVASAPEVVEAPEAVAAEAPTEVAAEPAVASTEAPGTGVVPEEAASTDVPNVASDAAEATQESSEPVTTAPIAASEQVSAGEFPVAAPTSEPDDLSVDTHVSTGQGTPADAMIVTPGGGSIVQPKQVSTPAATVTTFGASSPEGAAKNKRGMSKKLIIVLIAVLVLLIAGGVYVFAFFLPNRPEAVYSTAMSRTADAVDMLVTEATSAYENEAYKGVKLEGTYKIASDNVNAEGDMSMQLNRSGDFTGSLNLNAMGEKFSADFRGLKAGDSVSPDLYVKVDGVTILASYIGADTAEALNNTWIEVDHTLVDSAQSSVVGESASTLPDEKHIASAINALQSVNRQYIFTDDIEKAVFEYGEFIGREEKDGRVLNHYSITLNKEHLKKYYAEVAKALDTSTFNEWYNTQYDGKNVSDLMTEDAISKQVDELEAADAYDLYVDVSTKLIQGVAQSVTSENGEYIEYVLLSQSYDGGDEYPFAVLMTETYNGDPYGNKVNITATINKQTKKAALGFELTNAADPSSWSVSLNVSAEPMNDEVKVTKPEGAKSINDVIRELGVSDVLGAQTTVPNIFSDSVFEGASQ